MNKEETFRIVRIIAKAGFCSRRQAADFLNENKVVYKGEQITRPDLYLTLEQAKEVYVNGDKIKIDGDVTIVLLYKPTGYVCSHKPQKGQKTIFSLLPPKFHQYFYAGRLDIDSEGLIVLSNDGSLIFDLTHPSKSKKKVYEITIARPLSTKEEIKARNGFHDKSEKINIDDLILIKPAFYRVTMTHGKNREIRRVMRRIGSDVKTLKRLSLGKYSLDELKSGKHKVL